MMAQLRPEMDIGRLFTRSGGSNPTDHTHLCTTKQYGKVNYVITANFIFPYTGAAKTYIIYELSY